MLALPCLAVLLVLSAASRLVFWQSQAAIDCLAFKKGCPQPLMDRAFAGRVPGDALNTRACGQPSFGEGVTEPSHRRSMVFNSPTVGEMPRRGREGNTPKTWLLLFQMGFDFSPVLFLLFYLSPNFFPKGRGAFRVLRTPRGVGVCGAP